MTLGSEARLIHRPARALAEAVASALRDQGAAHVIVRHVSAITGEWAVLLCRDDPLLFPFTLYSAVIFGPFLPPLVSPLTNIAADYAAQMRARLSQADGQQVAR